MMYRKCSQHKHQVSRFSRAIPSTKGSEPHHLRENSQLKRSKLSERGRPLATNSLSAQCGFQITGWAENRGGQFNRKQWKTPWKRPGDMRRNAWISLDAWNDWTTIPSTLPREVNSAKMCFCVLRDDACAGSPLLTSAMCTLGVSPSGAIVLNPSLYLSDWCNKKSWKSSRWGTFECCIMSSEEVSFEVLRHPSWQTSFRKSPCKKHGINTFLAWTQINGRFWSWFEKLPAGTEGVFFFGETRCPSCMKILLFLLYPGVVSKSKSEVAAPGEDGEHKYKSERELPDGDSAANQRLQAAAQPAHRPLVHAADTERHRAARPSRVAVARARTGHEHRSLQFVFYSGAQHHPHHYQSVAGLVGFSRTRTGQSTKWAHFCDKYQSQKRRQRPRGCPQFKYRVPQNESEGAHGTPR